MNTKLISDITSEYKKVKHPEFKVGDVIEVHEKIKEDDKERIQVFKGVVLAIKGSGVSKTFTIRKISYGIGVEKVYPFYSPNIAKIKIVKKAVKIKRSKLYYLRKRIGKSALKAGIQIPAEGEDLETKFEEESKEKQEEKEEEQKDKEKTDDSKQKSEKETKVEEKKVKEKEDKTEKTAEKKEKKEDKKEEAKK